jgi:nitrite reductase/ring-hydroxylating ferredoxin subunit
MKSVKVASADNLGPGKMLSVEHEGKEILIAKINGNYYAMENRCTHMACMLSNGTLRGDNVTCPCHGSVFHVRTGEVLKGPARKPELTYTVRIEQNQIFVDI